MKIQITTILLILFLAAAQGGTLVNWAGNWDTFLIESENACYPDSTILIEQGVGKITASWVWGKTQPCTKAGIAGQKFTQTIQNPQGNSIPLKIAVGGATVEGTFTVAEDQAAFISKNGASAIYARRPEIAFWAGTWDIVTQSDEACNPDKSITVIQGQDKVSVQWIWANSKPCEAAGNAGVEFVATFDQPKGNALLVSVKAGGVVIQGMLAVIHDQAVFASIYGTSATFARRQELVNWIGTWNLFEIKVPGACYPDKSVIISASEGNLVASWTWETSELCTKAGLSGQPYTQTLPIPKGSALSLNFVVGKAFVSGIFILEGDIAGFASWTGAAAIFQRKPQTANWAGTWNIATQDKTACYPEGSIIVAQSSKDITVSWTWANTSPCTTLDLAGKKFSKTTDIPAGNSLKLDVSTSVSALFTVYLDGAVFSTTRGAATTFDRKSSSSMGIIIVVLLLIVAAAAGGYFFIQKKKKLVQSDLNASLGDIYARA